MKYTKLQKQLMIVGDSNAPADKKREAWEACTVGDDGYAAFTYRLAKSYSKRDSSLCDDLVQETYLKVGEAAKKYRPVGSAHGWRKVVTQRAMFDIYRTKKSREEKVRTMGYSAVYDIEKFIGDDPHLPSD